MTAALASFGHFLAFFSICTALVVQLVLLSVMSSVEHAKRIYRANLVYLLSMLAILVFGTLRVFYFEKGSDYYFSNIFFIIKMLVFVLIILLHSIPALEFFSWREAITHEKLPAISNKRIRQLRLIIHTELTGIGIILLCAALMAHGIGEI